MKKHNSFGIHIPKKTIINKTIEFTRVAIILLFIGLFCAVTQSANAQNTKVSITKQNVKLSEIINEIEQQTNYLFIYDNEVNVIQTVSVNVKNIPVSNVLNALFEKINIKYVLKGNHIILSVKENTQKQEKIQPQKKQQQKKISGRVVDLDGESIIGANIIEENTVNNGTITNIDGSFSIEVADNAVLRVTYIGYLEEKVNTYGKSIFQILLKEDSKTLDEAVVVGYGTQKKVNLTGAVNQISAETLVDRPVVKISSALQGVIPNLTVGFSGGTPGEMGSLNIRGYTSINGGSPLVLIDGLPGTLDRVSPEEVQTITVLKDASSAAIYGARAAFGVILVTTKNGSSGKMKISYNTNIAFSTPTISTNFITTGYDWMRLNDASATYMGGYSGYTDDDMYQLYLRKNDKVMNPERPWITIQNRNGRDQYVYYGNYDWWDYMFKKWQTSKNHNINISGGNEKINFMLNGNVKIAEGIMNIHPDNFQSSAIRSKINAQIYKWLKISNNTNIFHSSYDYTGKEGGGNANFTNMTVHASPAYSPINPDGTPTYKSGLNSYAIGDGNYPLFFEGNSKGADRKYEITTVSEVVITPFKDLDIVGNYSYNMYFSPNFYRQEPASYSLYPGVIEPTPNYNVDQLKERMLFNQVHVINLYGNYSKTIKNHSVKLIVGFNQEVHYDKTVTAMTDDLLSETLNDLSLGTGVQQVSGGSSSYALRGTFFRLNYDYMGKYLFETNGRYDGTSRFPKNRRFGFFPSFSGGWRVSEENFFSPLKNVVSNMKIRASYGSLGNQAISSPYPYISTMNPGNLSYIQNGKTIEYISTPAPISGDLTWEKVTSINIGVDMSFFDNKLEFSFDRYKRLTIGMVDQGLQLPNVFGATEPQENTADLMTKGFELSLGWFDSFLLREKKFSYRASFVLSDNSAYITKINNPTKLITSNYEGKKIGDIWGYITDGYFKSDAEASTYPINQVWVNRLMVANNIPLAAGDMRFVDLDGDGVITAGQNTVDNPGDQKIIGNSTPRFSYGLNMSADWNNFDFSVFLQGIGRMDWYPGSKADRYWGPYSRPYSSFIPEDFESLVWSKDNPNAYFPRLFTYSALNDRNELYVANNKYLQNLAYLRLKNIMLGYTLPNSLTSKVEISKLRIFMNAENIFTWTALETKYIDPEQAMSDIHARTYPFSKTYSIGLNLTF